MPFGADETSEVLLDLLEHTALVAPDALALVRGRTADGIPLTQALIDEAVATSDGIARMLVCATTFGSSTSQASPSPSTRPS